MNKILMIFLLTILTGCSEVANSEESISTISELDQTISHSIVENFGYRHEIEDDAVKLIEFDEETGKMKIIVFTYAFEDESYEEFKADILESCANVLQDIKRQSEVQEVDLFIETPIEDLDGNPDYNGTIFNMVFERKNLNNTDFHELDPLNLSKKAKFYFQAPVTE
jgi:hypothetical protein